MAIAPTGDAALDQAAHDASTLVSLRESAPVGPFALIGRARGDLERLRTALDSFGYYKGSVTITVDGRALDDPGLAGALEALPAGAAVQVAVTLGARAAVSSAPCRPAARCAGGGADWR